MDNYHFPYSGSHVGQLLLLCATWQAKGLLVIRNHRKNGYPWNSHLLFPEQLFDIKN